MNKKSKLSPQLRELVKENQELRNRLMTLMDIAGEAADDKQSYDFKQRAEFACRDTLNYLIPKKRG